LTALIGAALLLALIRWSTGGDVCDRVEG
jgi:hypothetical protein